MFESLNPSQLLSKILGLQKHVYPSDAGKNTVVKDNYMNEFSKSEHSVRIIFDHVNFKILQISDNIEKVMGHSAKDFYKPSLAFIFNFYTLDHYNFMYIWLKWSLSLHARLEGDELARRMFNVKHAICGVKTKHKDGHVMRVMFRHYTLEQTETGLPIVAAITIDDISHLIKPDFNHYWGRIESGRDERFFHHLISTDKKSIEADILSDREKDVLRLLAKGKESKEIGGILSISSHTVDNHRRNMLSRIGARDTTGLIQICNMIGMLSAPDVPLSNRAK
jgi:DNA-binding CsgD family transcriptional regulator